MNWLETLLHLAPDQGDGTFEALLLLAVLAALVRWRARMRTVVR